MGSAKLPALYSDWFADKAWVSFKDLMLLFRRSLESDVRFGVYFGISNNTNSLWDISNARRELGYAPQDNASDK